jgi:hypothetical protein
MREELLFSDYDAASRGHYNMSWIGEFSIADGRGWQGRHFRESLVVGPSSAVF